MALITPSLSTATRPILMIISHRARSLSFVRNNQLAAPLSVPLTCSTVLANSQRQDAGWRHFSAVVGSDGTVAALKPRSIGRRQQKKGQVYDYESAAHRGWLANRKTGVKVRFLGKDLNALDRPKVVVLGTGWAAVSFLSSIDVTKFDVTVVSPRVFFAFTPFLPAVCGGSLTSRSSMQPVRRVLKCGGQQAMLMQEAKATDVDFENQTVLCEANNGFQFRQAYDHLVVACGVQSATHNVPGVKEYCLFLKEVEHAAAVFRSVISGLEAASLPGVSEEEQKRLLHFVLVGAGPSGCECAAEILDYLHSEGARDFPRVAHLARVTLVDALPRLLPMLPKTLSDIAMDQFRRPNVDLRLRTGVTNVEEKEITMKDLDTNEEVTLPYGVCVWNTGNVAQELGQELVKRLGDAQKGNRVLSVDEHLRVKGAANVFGMGDCVKVAPKAVADLAEEIFQEVRGEANPWSAVVVSLQRRRIFYPQLAASKWNLKKCPPPDGATITLNDLTGYLRTIDYGYAAPVPTAQNAKYAGMYLAAVFNNNLYRRVVCNATGVEPAVDWNQVPGFLERWKGTLTYVGDGRVIAVTPWSSLKGGVGSHLFWKALYWSMQSTAPNKLGVVFDWCRVSLFGRDSMYLPPARPSALAAAAGSAETKRHQQLQRRQQRQEEQKIAALLSAPCLSRALRPPPVANNSVRINEISVAAALPSTAASDSVAAKPNGWLAKDA